MAFKTWAAGEVLTAADLNGSFAVCVRTDAAKTITVSHVWSAAQKFADGTAGAPIVAFNSDVDTGLFRQGANAIGLAAGGSEVARITTNGLRAGDIGEGELADARLSSNVPLLDQANTFTSRILVDRATGQGFAVRKSGESGERWSVLTQTGEFQWSDGTNPVDTNLYRVSGGGMLATDDNFRAGGTLEWGGGGSIADSDSVLAEDANGDVSITRHLTVGDELRIANADTNFTRSRANVARLNEALEFPVSSQVSTGLGTGEGRLHIQSGGGGGNYELVIVWSDGTTDVIATGPAV